MQLKIFGDATPIDWQVLNVGMPFAPMHELAKKYEKKLHANDYIEAIFAKLNVNSQDLDRTFESKLSSKPAGLVSNFLDRIDYRTRNTVAALDQCTSVTICINIGGGYHHGQKYPKDGYAYSLINDIIWAVDYQLEKNPTKQIGIIDLDFHFGGGTWDYYKNWGNPYIADLFHPNGILYKHSHLVKPHQGLTKLEVPLISNHLDKILLNIGTDWFHDDCMFGKYGQMYAVPLQEIWMKTIEKILELKIPLAITMGGGYGADGLLLYENFISWLEQV